MKLHKKFPGGAQVPNCNSAIIRKNPQHCFIGKNKAIGSIRQGLAKTLRICLLYARGLSNHLEKYYIKFIYREGIVICFYPRIKKIWEIQIRSNFELFKYGFQVRVNG